MTIIAKRSVQLKGHIYSKGEPAEWSGTIDSRIAANFMTKDGKDLVVSTGNGEPGTGNGEKGEKGTPGDIGQPANEQGAEKPAGEKGGDKNITLPRGLDPMKVSLEECIGIISSEKEKPVAGTTILAFPDKGIEVINGRYGPYIKHDGANYRIPAGKDAAALTAEECEAIVAAAPAPKKSRRRS